MSRFPFVPWTVAGLVFSAALAAQDDVSAMHARLVDGDAARVERGRRELLDRPVADLHPDVLVRLLRSRDEFRRAAAGGLLLAGKLAGTEVAAWLAEENDPRVLVHLVELLPQEVLLRVVTQQRRYIDAEDVDREDSERELRDRAFARLVDLGAADAALWSRVVNGEDALLADFAVELATEEVWPFPIAHIDELSPSARLRVLDALGTRPRSDLAAALDGMLARKDLPIAERLLALTARRSEDWERSDVEALVNAALVEDQDLARAAEHASWLVAPSVATRMVGEVHRRLLEGTDIAPMLDLLRNVDHKGERMLVSLARQLKDRDRDAIVSWLGRRESPQLDVLLREALDGEYPLTPEILRRTGALLDTEARRARVLQFLRELTQQEAQLLGATAVAPATIDLAARTSAFDALCAAGVWGDALLDFALSEPDEQPGRIGVMLRMPHAGIPAAAFEKLIARTDQRAAARLIGELMREPLPEVVEDALAIRALSSAPTADAAAEACLRAGSETVAERVWNGLDAQRRRNQANALRIRNDGFARRVLMAQPLDGDRGALGFARLALGDRAVLQALLLDASTWDREWLRRTVEILPPMLEQVDVDGLVRRFDGLDAALQPIVLGWIAARPELDDHGLCAKLFARDEADLLSELRPAALRRMLATEEGRAALRAKLDASFAQGLDDVQQDEAYDVIGAGPAPLDAPTARFLARFLLVEPLAHLDTELQAALRHGPVPHEPRAQLAFQRMVRETSPASADAFAVAMRDARTSPSFRLTSAARLQRLLEVFVREESTRDAVCPILAQAIVELHDLDLRPLGPAHQMLAEQAESKGDFAQAAREWDLAAHWYLRAPMTPLAQRAFVGESSAFEGTSSTAWLASRAPLCRARAAHAAGDKERVARALAEAEPRAFGDRRALAEVRALAEEYAK